MALVLPDDDYDGFEALDAALSFVDAYISIPSFELPTPLAPLKANFRAPDVANVKENGRFRVAGGCRKSHCQAALDTEKNKPKKRIKVNPNRARNERKNELAYLRNKVKQMETELGEHIPLTASNNPDIPPFWKDMATRQKLRREKAERENARLKLVLEGQIKARSLEALLQKRVRQQVSECAGHLGKVGDQGRTLDFLADKSTFDALLTSVDAAFHEVDQVFATNGLISNETSSHDARMREGANGMYLDISSTKLLPFSQDTVGATVWSHFNSTEKHRGNLYEKAVKKLDTKDDTVMEDFKMEFLGKSTRADFRVKQVLRRYNEAERQVVVWVTSVHSLDEGKTRPFAGLGFAEKGYAVIKQPTSPALLKAGFTVLQMCSLVVPQKAESCIGDATSVGAFTEFVLNVIVANTTVSQERIENMLLDQALKGAPPP
ncbi:M96 mating-specific protein family [Phytophthora infestans T30-4]|uniref:M96 mating-specific protein family n=1 Tax=Phytophthora infestans (strain T30-4) TaxID=403677 RepID=D0NTI2_PHYIT|nr:M96 mating-specific protein family [Phytophthora infestans T30-4]EEY64933.1 M96 mating-specific protein family [Phytophthora infestans T30-4]|eukprot:XP_002897663.1 M96 mating-specific protein family [Phytophthora infestans T30-4]